jgi:hypothetical protein
MQKNKGKVISKAKADGNHDFMILKRTNILINIIYDSINLLWSQEVDENISGFKNNNITVYKVHF